MQLRAGNSLQTQLFPSVQKNNQTYVKSRSVFIVEDNEHYSMLLYLRLQDKFNLKISTFATGEKCLNSLRENPDLIILDYSLPGINGLNTLQKIRAVNSKVPVIIISAQTSPQVAADLITAGADEYIIKNRSTTERLEEMLYRFI